MGGGSSSCRPSGIARDTEDTEFDEWADRILQKEPSTNTAGRQGGGPIDEGAQQHKTSLDPIKEEVQRQPALPLGVDGPRQERHRTRHKQRPGSLSLLESALSVRPSVTSPASQKENLVSPVESPPIRKARHRKSKRLNKVALPLPAQNTPNRTFRERPQKQAPQRHLNDHERRLFKCVMEQDISSLSALFESGDGGTLLATRNASGMTALELARDRQKWQSEAVLLLFIQEAAEREGISHSSSEANLNIFRQQRSETSARHEQTSAESNQDLLVASKSAPVHQHDHGLNHGGVELAPAQSRRSASELMAAKMSTLRGVDRRALLGSVMAKTILDTACGGGGSFKAHAEQPEQ